MPAYKAPTAKQLKKQIDNWNAKHPVGTILIYEEIKGGGESHSGASTSEAEILSGHTAVIWIEGKRGCVCLDHCKDAT